METSTTAHKYTLYTGDYPSSIHAPPLSFKQRKLGLIPAVLATIGLYYVASPSVTFSLLVPYLVYFVHACTSNTPVKVDGKLQLTVLKDLDDLTAFLPGINFGFFMPRAMREKSSVLFHEITREWGYEYTESNGRLAFTTDSILTEHMLQLQNSEYFRLADIQSPLNHAPIVYYYLRHLVHGMINVFATAQVRFMNAEGPVMTLLCNALNPTFVTTKKADADPGPNEYRKWGLSFNPLHEKISSCFGSAERAPHGGKAILFPFFEGLLARDETFVPTIIRRYFYAHLGDGENDQRETFDSIKEVWKFVSGSLYGQVVGHMFLAIKMALELESFVYFVVDKGGYGGFILYTSVSVWNKGVEFTPVESTMWLQSIDVFLSEGAVRDRICTILSGMERISGSIDAVYPHQISTAWDLANILTKYQFKPTLPGLNELQGLLNRCSSKVFWTPNKESIADMCLFVTGDPGDAYGQETPMCFAGIIALGRVDRMALALMPFGERAPAWYNGNAEGIKCFDIPRDVTKSLPFYGPNTGQIKCFPNAPVPLAQAIISLRQMCQKRKFSFKLGPKGYPSGQRTAAWYEGADGEMLFKALANMVHKQTEIAEQLDPEGTVLQKRKREEDDGKSKALAAKFARLTAIGVSSMDTS